MPVLSNPRHEQFAQLIAAGHNVTEAYVKAGYSASGASQSGYRLGQVAEVQARIAEIRAEISAGMVKASIRDRNARIAALQDRWERMQRVIEARAADPDHASAPGGDTGLLVRQFKIVGRGEDAKPVEEFSVDTGLLSEMRQAELQAAKEEGQLAEKHEHSGPGGGPIPVTDERLGRLSDAELEALKTLVRKVEAD